MARRPSRCRPVRILEDVDLAWNIKRAASRNQGRSIRLRYAPDALSTRMYRHLRRDDSKAGRRISHCSFRTRSSLAAHGGCWTMLLLFGLPLLLLVLPHLTQLQRMAHCRGLGADRLSLLLARVARSNFGFADCALSLLGLPLFIVPVGAKLDAAQDISPNASHGRAGNDRTDTRSARHASLRHTPASYLELVCKSMILLTRKADFSAAHFYWNPVWSEAKKIMRVFGKCANREGHGHNYTLEVTVAGEVDPVTGFVVDLKQLKDIMEQEVVVGLRPSPPESRGAGVRERPSHHGEHRHRHLAIASTARSPTRRCTASAYTRWPTSSPITWEKTA